MKKIKFVAPILALPIIGFAPILSNCNNQYNSKIHLKNFSDPSLVVGVDKSDFWLCAEPAAYVKEKVLGLNRVGSLQQLYGGKGFNQAVLVCKKELLTSNPKYLNQIKTYLKGNKDYVSEEGNRVEIITNIQNNQYDSSKSSSLDLNNTSTQSLINCNAIYDENFINDEISYYYFIGRSNEIDSNVQTAPLDFYKGFPDDSSKTTTDNYKIYAPDGAPAVGLANVLKNKDSLCNSTTIKYLNPTLMMAKITTEWPDLAVLPSNLATKLYNEHDQKYVFLATVTWGNLYFLSKKYSEQLTLDNLKTQLYGKLVGVQQLPSTPGLALKIILKDNNIDYEE